MKYILLPIVLCGCPSPTEAPPTTPTFPTDGPPVTPAVETCDAAASDLPFSASWSPLVFAPRQDTVSTELTGTLSVPTALGLDLSAIEVLGQAGVLSDLTDDGTTQTAAFQATVSCAQPCTALDILLDDSVRLLAPSADVPFTLDTTALALLDLQRAQAAARNGFSGLTPGMLPELDAQVPAVVTALQEETVWPVGPGGRLDTTSETFSVVDDALATPGVDAPNLPGDSAWSLHSLEVPDGARLVVWTEDQVSVPAAPDATGELTFHTTVPAGGQYHARFGFEDGRQSAATVFVEAEASPGTLSISGGDGDSIAVAGATPGAWVLQRSNTTDVQGACLADDAGEALLSADRTASFLVAEANVDLELTALSDCSWEQGEAVCTPL